MLAEATTLDTDTGGDEIWRWIAGAADLLALPSKLGMLARCWMACRPDGAMVPRRTDLDPAEFKSILPNVLMFGLERQDGALKAVRIRLMGTALVRVYGRDWTGLTTRDFDREDQVADHLRRMQSIVDRRQMLYWRHWSLARGSEDLFAEHLFCPLTDADGTVAYVITVLDFPGMEYDPRVRDSFSPLLIRHR
ncbi:MAG: PAS domain-containing protein [Alphaproteobacteria bacterium]